MTIHARITKIDIDRFQVELSSKSSDLLDKENNWRPPKDLYYDVDAEKEICDKEQEKKKQQARQTYIKRVIAHPSFHNVGYKECEKLLDAIDQGEVIIRPSSKGSDHLTVTWKVSDGILQHIDVLEEGKENAFSLGKSLLINTEEFEDLDEIIARYIQPMAAFTRDVLSFKYYRPSDGGKKDVLDKLLTEEKKKAPSRIPYFLSASRQYPGKFLISYLPKTKVRHEYVSVQPEGFKYRQQVFHSLNSLVRWFKEHFRDPIPGTPASTRTPMMRSSVYATPSMSIKGMDSGVMQRGTPGMPSNVYNSMSQMTGGTPQHFGSSSNFAGGYSGGYNFQVSTPLMTPMMTPASHYAQSIATPAQQQLATPTPSYQPTPRSGWPGTTPRGMTPRAMTPRAMPRTPSHPARTTTHLSHRQTPQAGTAGTDWAKAAEMWARRSRADGRRPTTPRGQSPRNMQSPMEPTGDSTPLFDER